MVNDHYYTGSDVVIQPNSIVGLKYKDKCGPVRFEGQAVVRAGTIIYGDVTTGDDFQTGHNVMIRENTTIGSHVVIGTNTVVDGNVVIGDFVKIETGCYIPTHVEIGSRVFIGPCTTLTNDRYPLKLREQYKPEGPIIEDGVTIGGGCVIVPGVRIGRGAFIAAGAVVTKDVPEMTFVKGVPGEFYKMPSHLTEYNMALNWRKYFEQ